MMIKAGFTVPRTFFDNLFIYENYVANEAAKSQYRKTTHRRFSIHRLFGGILNDGLKLQSKKQLSSEAILEPLAPLPSIKGTKKHTGMFNDRLSVGNEEIILEAQTASDKASVEKQYEDTSFNLADDQFSISGLDEVD
ncbi:unnamed protein product [Ambrosiozyma monospora]|uniref:Unnamed protein product n=1 Tax=Ambrosiozyma monospora TaxID=43982 RepID=A0ACB5T2K2_AMBMO|nr:unnamed protein product [Ambrosiozyma monospora]